MGMSSEQPNMDDFACAAHAQNCTFQPQTPFTVYDILGKRPTHVQTGI